MFSEYNIANPITPAVPAHITMPIQVRTTPEATTRALLQVATIPQTSITCIESHRSVNPISATAMALNHNNSRHILMQPNAMLKDRIAHFMNRYCFSAISSPNYTRTIASTEHHSANNCCHYSAACRSNNFAGSRQQRNHYMERHHLLYDKLCLILPERTNRACPLLRHR